MTRPMLRHILIRGRVMDRIYRKQTEKIKEAIVDTYRRGACTSDGGFIPEVQRGTAGRGSKFMPARTAAWYRNFAQIDWSRGRSV